MHSIEQKLSQIALFQCVHPHLFSSAIPNLDQLSQIKAYGIDTLIYIAPHPSPSLDTVQPDAAQPCADIENSLHLDQQCLALGLNYIHIPLDFENPVADQALLILDLIDVLCGNKMLWLSCPNLQRCSSLLHVYRQFYMHMDMATAHSLLESVWEPDATWTGLIHALTLQLLGRKATQELEQDLQYNFNQTQDPTHRITATDATPADLDTDNENDRPAPVDHQPD